MKDSDIALVPLVSLTPGIDRQKQLIDGAEGFIYAVAKIYPRPKQVKLKQ